MKKGLTTLSQTIDGYLLAVAAERLSPHTIADYTNAFRKLQAFLGDDPPLSSIKPNDIRNFLADLEVPRAPAGTASRPARPLSKKTVLNIHTGLSALWTWAVEEGLVRTHVLHAVDAPKPERRAIEPFTEQEVKALLAGCERSRAYDRPGKKTCDHRRSTGVRDRAIILLLLDTGMRASELCDLTINQVNLKTRQVKVFGKGDSERILQISPTTSKALWKYLSTERAEEKANAPVFMGRNGDPLTRSGLLQLLRSLGERTGVRDCHPHRFRHTFAVNFLRNGANIFALQMSLGHTTLAMVQRYLMLAQADLEAAHKQASPVEHWRL